MKNSINILKWVVRALVLVVVILVLWWLLFSEKDNHIAIEVDDGIDVTPQQIESIRTIGQWEFLALTDEEMVDTIRQGFFFDDQLVRIYYGTLRLGIDMQQLSDSAFTSRGDTLDVTLPAIQLLDYNFIDEARTRSFISKGNWDASDREALYRRAKAKMLRQCLTPRNIRRARQNAEEQVTDMLRVMGFEKVNLKWKD